MASLMIHLAAGQEFCKKQFVENEEEFLKGNLEPDLCSDKEAGHFVNSEKPDNYDDSIKNRVNLVAYCKTCEIKNSFDLGYFFHLLTDYIFYNKYMINLKSYREINDKTYKYVNKMVYDDYGRVGAYLVNVFSDLKLEMLPEFARIQDKSKLKIFTEKGLDKVVELCAQVDLFKTYNEIKTKNENIIILTNGEEFLDEI